MNRRLYLWAAGLNLFLGTVAYLRFGWTAFGSHVAARYTARFAALLFILAYAAPGLQRLFSALPCSVRSIRTYVSAHCVHFIAVALVILVDKANHLRHLSTTTVLIVVIGSGLVLSAAATVTLTGSLLGRILHEVNLLLLFLIFLAAFAKHPSAPYRTVTILLVASLLTRIAGLVQTLAKPQARTATAR